MSWTLSKRDRLLHDVGVLVKSLWQAGTYDPLNLGDMVSFEVLSRRLSEVVDATTDGLLVLTGIRCGKPQISCNMSYAPLSDEWNVKNMAPRLGKGSTRNSTATRAVTDGDVNGKLQAKPSEEILERGRGGQRTYRSGILSSSWQAQESRLCHLIKNDGLGDMFRHVSPWKEGLQKGTEERRRPDTRRAWWRSPSDHRLQFQERARQRTSA